MPKSPLSNRAKHGDTILFDAHAVFQDAVMEQVPADLGIVQAALTRGAAKEASAERVLEWLKERERERDGEFRGVGG